MLLATLAEATALAETKRLATIAGIEAAAGIELTSAAAKALGLGAPGAAPIAGGLTATITGILGAIPLWGWLALAIGGATLAVALHLRRVKELNLEARRGITLQRELSSEIDRTAQVVQRARRELRTGGELEMAYARYFRDVREDMTRLRYFSRRPGE